MAAAEGRGLPMVSVRSGRQADGYASVGGIEVPLTQSEFERLLSMRWRKSSGLRGAVGFLLGAMAMSKFTVLLYLGILISFISGLMWLVATIAVTRLLPAVQIDRVRGTVSLAGVHRRFVRAVADADI